jgi:hypothetical protein
MWCDVMDVKRGVIDESYSYSDENKYNDSQINSKAK